MLTVVFGAGASFDSDPSRPPGSFTREPHRPPLANELFDERFSSDLAYFQAALPIVPLLRYRPNGQSVEQMLGVLQEEGQDDPQRAVQLAAIRFYLQLMLSGLDRQWMTESKGVTNYRTLLDEIRRLRPTREPVLLVTFNYDRLLRTDWPPLGCPSMSSATTPGARTS